jgi:hypothetical protein
MEMTTFAAAIIRRAFFTTTPAMADDRAIDPLEEIELDRHASFSVSSPRRIFSHNALPPLVAIRTRSFADRLFFRALPPFVPASDLVCLPIATESSKSTTEQQA